MDSGIHQNDELLIQNCPSIHVNTFGILIVVAMIEIIVDFLSLTDRQNDFTYLVVGFERTMGFGYFF